MDFQHLYIDGSKFEANANRYSFAWKKGTEKQQYKLFGKITALFEEMNETLKYYGVHIPVSSEYAPEGLELTAKRYLEVIGLDESKLVTGKGHRKSLEQKLYEKLGLYKDKLSEYVEKLTICGPDRNSYSKTNHDATFMRMNRDYMGNDQLLPAYSVKIGVADEYIAVLDVQQYRSDMDCFVLLMEKFKEQYCFYPKYPVVNAGYGSFNNYIFCQTNGMEKYMKFTMYRKETKDAAYRDDPFWAVNFKTDGDGDLVCPNNRKFKLSYRQDIKGNKYGRQEEVYECEDCSGCPYARNARRRRRTGRYGSTVS